MFHLMMAFLACARGASGLSASLSVGAPPVRAAATSSGRVGTVLIRNTQRTVPIDVDAPDPAVVEQQRALVAEHRAARLAALQAREAVAPQPTTTCAGGRDPEGRRSEEDPWKGIGFGL